MGRDKKSILKDLLYNLQGMDLLSDDDMGQTYGGNSNHTQNNDDGNIGDDVPL